MVEVEKEYGIRTVGVVASDFSKDWESTAYAAGLPELSYVSTPLPLTGLTPQETRAAADKLIDGIIESITRPIKSEMGSIVHGISTPGGVSPIEEPVIKVTGKDYNEAYDNFQKTFLKWGWSDGFPLVPPTRERVEKMLKGTTHDSQEAVVDKFIPAMGKATVEKIAIAAVMAGAKPEYLPVLLAAAEAVHKDPIFLVCCQSTGPHAAFFWINGPIRDEIGINYTASPLGPGSRNHANMAIGRAFRLMQMNLGGTYLGLKDMDVIGSANKFSLVIGENEEASPWVPYHVEKGFDPKSSTLSYLCIESQIEVGDMGVTTTDRLVNAYAHTLTSIGAYNTRPCRPAPSDPLSSPSGGDNLILLPGDHATVLEKAGWTKDAFRQALYREARIPKRIFDISERKVMGYLDCPEYSNLPSDALVPITPDPANFVILRVGSTVGKGSVFFGLNQDVITVDIDRWR
jgi:hypothetical protein